MFFQVNSSTFPNIGLFLNYFVRESVNFISLISTGSVGIEKDLICTDPQKLDRKNLTFGGRFNHRPFHLWLGMSNPPNWIFLLTHLFPFSNFRGQVKKVPRTVALSGFRGQVKKPDCSGLEPLRRSHLKSLRLAGYETCRWPDGSNSLGLDCWRLWKKGKRRFPQFKSTKSTLTEASLPWFPS